MQIARSRHNMTLHFDDENFRLELFHRYNEKLMRKLFERNQIKRKLNKDVVWNVSKLFPIIRCSLINFSLKKHFLSCIIMQVFFF